MSYTLCQRCNNENTEVWNMRQAKFHVGRIEHWTVQVCPACVTAIEQVLLAVLHVPQAATDRAKARALLQSWLAEDVNTTDGSMELLKADLDKDRESGRKLFLERGVQP